jgi:Nitrate and nitrite sensing/Histidine kinase-, DNA gyrase B-, and HSP90-like ATPase
MAIFRRPARSRPIRLFLFGMLAVPFLSLVGLWVLAGSVTLPAAISDHQYSASETALTNPASNALTSELPTERREAYVWLLGRRAGTNGSLVATRAVVDKALPGAESGLEVDDNVLSASSRGALRTLLADLQGLSGLRQAVDSGQLSPLAAFQAYDKIIDDEDAAYYAAVVDRTASLQAPAIGDIDMLYSVEMTSREITLVDSALAATHGTLAPAARLLFIAAMAERRQLSTTGVPLLPADLRRPLLSLADSATNQRFQTMENEIATSTGNGPVPVNAATWYSVSEKYIAALIASETGIEQQLAALSQSNSNGLIDEAVLAGGLGLLAVLISLIMLTWFGRRVTGDLTALHASVSEMAEKRLPRVVDRLRRGEDVDVLAESPPAGTSIIREISQIARSFGVVQEEAVAAAVEQARQRKAVNRVFLNISLRSQSLLHRQLGMLDSMERQTNDPEALAGLFRLDHLTTRMQRHAEGLIILSGSTPGRGWRKPVPVVDVLRAAVAEIEDYVRVDVLSESRDLVAGDAVNDVIHLVAELVENAASFSPPSTRIDVRADRTGAGLVAVIEDRGLGLSDDELADINLHLASPSEFDLANSEQLGLFIVSRLAARRKIRVSLHHSVYGGTAAIILLPFGVIVREEEARQGRWPAKDSPAARPTESAHRTAPSEPPSRTMGSREAWALRAPGRHRRAMFESMPEAPHNGGPDRPSALSAVPSQEHRDITPWPNARHREAASRESPRPADPRPDSQPAGSISSGTHLGMPVRVPQASRARRFRAGRDTGAQPVVREGPAVEKRSPEAARDLMTSMQRGWQHGRADDLDHPTGAPTERNDRADRNGND